MGMSYVDAKLTRPDGSGDAVRVRFLIDTGAIRGERAVSPVVMGEAGDAPLLGAVTLETLGLMVSPVSRKLLPMRMMLASESVVPK